MSYNIFNTIIRIWFIPLFLSVASLTFSSNFIDDFSDSKEGDHRALMDLYESTNGDNWYNNTGWPSMTPETMGDAVGIEVNSSGRVVTIDMQSVRMSGDSQLGNNLSGTLPETIGNLTKVEVLKLKTNNLSGSIPSSIGNMTSLRWLALGGQRCDVDLTDYQWNENNHRSCPGEYGKEWQETNAFSGPIPPEIGNLTNLELFEARRQYLTGSIPPEIGNLTNLVGLFLNDQKGANPLGGELPTAMGNLKKLMHLHLDSRSNDAPAFTGNVPQEMLALTELRHIRLRGNNFDGPIPKFDTYDLRVITLNENNFTGEFPIEYFQGENPLLTNFMISNNELSGTLPTNMVPATYNGREWPYNSMSKFNIDGNNFTGPIPDWMQEMRGLQVFDVSSNELSDGGFPDKLLDRSDLKTLMLDGNSLGGNLPDKEWATDRILTIYASGNNFTGPIPDSWQTLATNQTRSNGMYIFYLQDNFLEGVIPRWFADLEADRIYVSNNKFTPKDILPYRDEINGGTGRYQYLPQKPFGSSRTVSMGTVIDMSSFDYSGNSYQWYKDGSPVSGATSPTIDTGSYGTGTYRLQITHPDINYTFESEAVETK